MTSLLRVLLGVNLASLLELLRRGPRAGAHASSRAFAAARSRPHIDDGIPRVGIGTVLGERRALVHLRAMQYEDGMLPSVHALSLLALLVSESPSSVLEIGTYMGHTTLMMAENLEGAMIHTVDLPPSFEVGMGPPKDDPHLIERRAVGREFANAACRNRIVQHLADTAHWDFSEAGQPSFFFIDGSHTYEYCRNDSEKCLAIAGGRPATIVWHDCDADHPGVVRLVQEWRGLGRNIRLLSGTSLAFWRTA
jgi:hypothetical protein